MHVRAMQRTPLYLGLGLMSVWVLWPVYWLVSASFKSLGEIRSNPPTLWPHVFTWSNYLHVISGFDARYNMTFPMATSLLHSFEVSVGVSAIGVLIASLAAYAIVKSRLQWMFAIFLVILLARAIPNIAVDIPIYLLFASLHLTNTIGGLILAELTLVVPLATFLMHSYFQELPKDLEEAAAVDGASRWYTLWRITFPLSLPGIAVAGIVSFILSYNSFLLPLILTNSASTQTLPVILSGFITEYGSLWNLLSAASTIAVLPVAAVAFFAQKGLIRGLSLGAVKG